MKSTYILSVWAILLSATYLLQSCGSSEDIARSAVLDYGNEELNIESDFQIFHTSRDSSKLFVKISSKNLLYTRSNSEQFTARVQVVITPYILGDKEAFKLKSKTIQFEDVDDTKQVKDLLVSTMLYLPDNESYSLSIKFIDLNKQREITKSYRTEKVYPHSRQFFMAAYHDMRVPIFGDRIGPNETITLKTNVGTTGTIHVSYYNRSFPMPPTPFAYYEPRPFDYTPDSTFTLMLDPWNKALFTSAEEGFYHFQIDPNQKDGFSLFVSDHDHPEVTEVHQLIDPFRYLVSSKEYANIVKDSEQKFRLESYWLDWCGNRERARSSIKAFYTRVEEANKYFSSYIDGWKTDRGLIYIVYGKPNKVYRSANVETWIYGEENNPMSISFNFSRVINPFTSNDYRLNREEYYKPTWYRSLEAWRNGRVY
jgi:GWxTD domain-containing protein